MIGTCEESRYIPFRLGGGGAHPDPEMGEGGSAGLKFLQASVRSKNRGGPSPGAAVVSIKYPVLIFRRLTRC